MFRVENTVQSGVGVENAPARLGRLTQAWLPRSAGWHGTSLSGARLAHAVTVVSETLADRDIGRESVVVLESDDSGRTFLVFLALVDRGARVILTSGSTALPSDAQPATHTVVLRDATHGEIDVRLTLRRIEHEAGMTRSEDASEAVGMRIHAWFERRRILAIRSSGTTTGEPTLVWKDGPDLVENVLDTVRAAGYGADDVFLPLLPLGGQYGSSVMLIATVIGAGIVFSNRTKIAESLRTIPRAGGRRAAGCRARSSSSCSRARAADGGSGDGLPHDASGRGGNPGDPAVSHRGDAAEWTDRELRRRPRDSGRASARLRRSR